MQKEQKREDKKVVYIQFKHTFHSNYFYTKLFYRKKIEELKERKNKTNGHFLKKSDIILYRKC